MNLKFVRRVSEQERAIRPFVIVKNKLTSVFNASVLLLTMNFVSRERAGHDGVKTRLVELRAEQEFF